LVGRGLVWEIDLEIINLVECVCECCLRYLVHPSNWILSFDAIINWVHIARDPTMAERTRILSTRAAIHTPIETTGRRFDDIKFCFVLIVDFEGWNKPPARFLNISQMLVSAEDSGLLFAAAFTSSYAAPEGAIDFDKIGFGFRVLDRHIKRMARGKTAAADEGKIFFGFGNNLLII